MKNIVYALFSVFSLLAFSNVAVHAQGTNRNPDVSNEELVAFEKSTEVPPNTVDSKILSAFTKKHKDASDVSWTKTGKLTSVYFTKNKQMMRCTYNEKGRLEYTIRYFNGTEVPENIINFVRNNGYTMPIMQVIEVNRYNRITQFVKMENDEYLLTLRIKEDEIAEHEVMKRKI